MENKLFSNRSESTHDVSQVNRKPIQFFSKIYLLKTHCTKLICLYLEQ